MKGVIIRKKTSDFDEAWIVWHPKQNIYTVQFSCGWDECPSGVVYFREFNDALAFKREKQPQYNIENVNPISVY